MKRQTNFFTNFICVFVCVALVVTTLYTSDFISEIFLDIGNDFVSFREDLTDGDITVNTSGAKTEETFSPSGFGGGGYKNTISLNSTPSDIVNLMKSAEGMYKNFTKTGDIKESFMKTSSATDSYSSIYVNNKTDFELDIKSVLDSKPTYSNITKDEPYILIYHTHTTEGYELLDLGWYSDDYNSRTEDTTRNMVRVGIELKKQLEEAGFKVIHDTNIYDRTYTGAYSRSLEMVKKKLEENPSIMITLDVHRDAIHYDGKVKCKPTAEINGKKAAQVMIITGCEGGGVSDFPEWYKNLVFSVNLQSEVEESYNGLMRPIFFCNRKYNMNVTPCSLLLEFGTDANTLEEAVYSASLVGKALGRMLNDELKDG